MRRYLFDRWIMNRAAKLQAEEAKQKALSIAEMEKASAEHHRMIWRYIRGVIYPELEKEAEIQMPKPYSLEGDFIVNRFNYKFHSSNSWDAGAKGLISVVKTEYQQFPILATLHKMYLDFSYLSEKLSYQLANLPAYTIERYANYAPGNLEPFVKSIQKDNSLPITNYNNLFWAVSFDLKQNDTVIFSPSWGINAYSFLPLQSEPGQKTWKFWQQQAALKIEERELKQRWAELEKEMKAYQNPEIY